MSHPLGSYTFAQAEDDNGFSEEKLPMHVVGGVGWAVGLLRDNPPDYDSASELASQVGAGNSTYTEYDLAITEAAESFLRDKKDTSQPWVAFVSLVSPHYPVTAPQEFYDMYDPEEMDMPVGYDLPIQARPLRAQKHRVILQIRPVF